MFEDIKSISAFESAYSLLEYVYGTEELESGLSADEVDCLKRLNDYEYLTFFLINENTVIVTEGYGDVSGSAMALNEFYKETLDYVKENA